MLLHRSNEYQAELEDMALNPSTSTATGGAPGPKGKPVNPTRPSPWRSYSGSYSNSPKTQSTGFSFATLSRNEDISDLISNTEPEDFSAAISRRENPRDVSSFLSIRDVLLHRRSFENSSSSSKFGSLGSTASRFIGLSAPPAAWAKPEVQISLQVADGVVAGSGTALIDEPQIPPVGDPFTEGETTPQMPRDVALPSQDTSVITTSTPAPSSYRPMTPSTANVSTIKGSTMRSNGPPVSEAESLASTLSSAVRYMLSPKSTVKSSSDGPIDDTAFRLALLGIDQGTSYPRIDDQPHLQYEFTIGNRLRFSCTAYYALQFSNLRKQCGVEETLLRSMERTTVWVAQGGKSRSSFFKTSDDRFILKTLVTAWNVADL